MPITHASAPPDAVAPRSDDAAPSTGFDGAEDSWAQAWGREYAGLLGYASHLLGGDLHAAEDALQETAIRLWRHPEVFAAQPSLGAWLRTVVRHIIIDRVRRQRARPPETLLAPGTSAGSELANSNDPSGDVASWESVSTILSALPPHHRVVVFDVYVRDRPLAAVAADLGIPTGTVKSRCHNALHRLRRSAGQDSPAQDVAEQESS